MRNLKRVLALAMAMVMTLGMMVIGANAASYTDAAQIDDNYAEAIEVLTGMGVTEGYGGSFHPTEILTRAEASALIYRVLTGDVTDAKKDLYDYSSFKDVPEGKWYTGYVTYAANGGYIKGYGDGNFGPSDKVTGVQVLAIMLRAIGYGQKGEYEGAGWKDNVLTDAQSLGLLQGVANISNLDKPAARELVAQLLFNAITEANIVYYTPALGYYTGDVLTGLTAQTLGKKVFGLTQSSAKHDDWGRPYYTWYEYTDTVANTVATITYPVTASFTTAVTECDVVSALGSKKDVTADLVTVNAVEKTNYLNGDNKFLAIGTTLKVGAQGRLTEVYSYVDYTGVAPVAKVDVVMIDTMLAKVEAVTDATYDAAGHLKDAAALYLTVYDRAGGVKAVLYNGSTNWTYSKGDYVLVNAQLASGDLTITTQAPTTVTYSGSTWYVPALMEVVSVAPSTTGVQTAYNTVAQTSVIGGTTYNWALKYFLGKVGTNRTTYIAYTDTYGNLIGQVEPDTVYSYGIITTAAWTNSYQPLTPAYAAGKLVFADASASDTVVLDEYLTHGAFRIDGTPTDAAAANGELNTDITKNTAYYDTIYKFTMNSDGEYSIVAAGTSITGYTTNIKTGTPTMFNTVSTNDNTVYLVKTGNAVTGYSYASYTGYKNVPSMNGVNVSYLDDGIYVTYAYIDATRASVTGSTFYALIGDDGIDGVSNANNIYYLYVAGEGSTAKPYIIADSKVLSAIGYTGRDVYKVTVNTNDEITKVEAYGTLTQGTDVKTITGVTGATATAITNGTITYNCTDAKYYQIVGTGVVVKTYADVVGSTAYCVLDANGYVTAVYF